MRQLLPALAASTALHVAVLAVAGSGRASRSAPAATPAVDIEIFAGPTGQSAHSSALAAALPSALVGAIPQTAARRALRRPKRVPAPVDLAPSMAAPAAVAPSVRVAEAPVASVPGSGPAARTTAKGAALGAARGETAKAGDPDLTAFFERLQRAARRCSGPRAGEGKVRFCVGADGTPTQVSLVQSTGNFALDDAALHCVIPGAAPFPRTDRCLVVPLRFQ